MYPAIIPQLSFIELIKLARAICPKMGLASAKYFTDFVIPVLRSQYPTDDAAILRSFIKLLAKINRGELVVDASLDGVSIRPTIPAALTKEQIVEVSK